MPSIRPFKAVVYNNKKIKKISKVVAPPYDVIAPDMQDKLYRIHENNIVRLILGKVKDGDTQTDNRYTRAASDFKFWLRENILMEESVPAIYIYTQTYTYDGRKIDRIGFISLMELDLEDKKVLPHEKTLKAPKEDRLRLMRAVKANLSPIFMLYEDAKHKVNNILRAFSKKTKPFIDVTIDSVRHRVWALTDKDAIGDIEGLMSKKDIFIADGHHRYETSKNYARELIEKSVPCTRAKRVVQGASQSLIDNSKFFMAYFVELEEKSLLIMPTHRLIKDARGLSKEEIIEKLRKYFIFEKLPTRKKLLARLGYLRSSHAFGMYLPCTSRGSAAPVQGGYYVLKLKDFNKAKTFMGEGSADWKSLDVSILHLFILQYVLGISDEDDNIEFVKDPGEAFKGIDKGGFNIAFFLNPTKVTQVKKIAEHGEKMPRKATYFYPKPLSGLVIRKM
ncbi:MAG: DUF1015 domain-containing protein [Candidatus Omnitrophica bacterium]|nr:DUF1015 domain-containing protein [Candidatus Omnitrophota bacterium]